MAGVTSSKKAAACFDAGVRKVRVCDLDGKVAFYSRDGLLNISPICPALPRQIPTTFLRRSVSTLLAVRVRLSIESGLMAHQR